MTHETADANQKQLAVLREFAAVCADAGIAYWLRGGWAMDFFLGRISREHDDIDLFIWNGDAPRLIRELERAGFIEIGGAPPEAQRNMMKEGQEFQIALLARRDDGAVVVAGGPSAGAPWPDGMLEGSPGRIDDLTCPIVNPRVQIEIKELFPRWLGVPMGAKHREDIARLREALERGSQITIRPYGDIREK